ncbi:zinc ribbon domain-containing protein [Croceicoccus sp. YJ47]|uniref:Zn-ribbon domain-containing OB-fold protein n=1 Tax=Croceicoccus sp. YJ47 TaxID=2798724 RepID=UPI0019226811|nr:zinc ribbon domain-containing protein [Croceicoccus sp. YJ47]QQN74393.1 OB-fold domain-containing protein [Croceicoccus sp. YJ47]
MTDQPRIAGGIGADDPFWDALEEGRFVAPKCSSCHQWMWPAHYRCGKCGSWDLDWEEIEMTGTLFTWTRNHAVSEVVKERREDTPFVTLLVELPQAGSIRIPGVLEGDEDGLAIGARLTGRIRPGDEKSKGYATVVWHLAEGNRA